MDEVQEVLATFREEPSPGLVMELHVARLLDAQDCASLMKTLQEKGGDWEVLRATKNLARRLPKESGLYMFVWSTPAVLEGEKHSLHLRYPLYVGKANNEGTSSLRSRYTEYAKYMQGGLERLWERDTTSSRKELLARWLTLKPLDYWFLCLPGIEDEELVRLERRLIRLLNPPLNKSNKPKLHVVKKSKPAF